MYRFVGARNNTEVSIQMFGLPRAKAKARDE